MNFSAASSSSSVVMPGRAFDLSTFMVRTRMSPEAAIWSTCSGVLRMIIPYTLAGPEGGGALDRAVALEAHRRQRAAQLLGHLVGVTLAVDPAQHALVVVVADQRLGLLVVGGEPLADHVGFV